MQGIYIKNKRPTSKKEVRQVASISPGDIQLEATSVFGNEYDGSIANAPDGTYTFVGPDPYTNRKFYGTIKKSGDKVTVS